MENTARLYNCARCHCQVVICSHCDRGNIYCSQSCADLARRESLRAAGKRYQRTRQGRFRHAQRQHRYRARKRKVTHQGSPFLPPNGSLTTWSEAPAGAALVEDNDIHCHLCGSLCSGFLRLDYLYRASPSCASDQTLTHRSRQGQAQAP